MKARRINRSLVFTVIIVSLVFIGKGVAMPALFPDSTPDPNLDATTNKFVIRSGSQLMLNEQPFRFAGANIHWLGLEDSDVHPSQFRVNDAFAAAKEMGLTVIRSHTLGISTGCGNCIEPSPGVFNKAALVHNDYVMKVARDHGMRLLIPLTDNWRFTPGGKHTFTDWRGIPDENQFYFNTEVINDFKQYIKMLLYHVNTYTGIVYKDDPTIMAWETGNELMPPTGWTQDISTFIKSIDNHHLIVDGRDGIDPDVASLTNVDIVSHHYYPMHISTIKDDANTAKRAGKAFVVGEFSWNDTDGGDKLNNFLSTIEANDAVAGDAFWELWPHDDQYGYVSSEIQYTLHYPGDTATMRTSVQQLRLHAYKMRNTPVPADSIPGVPLIEVVIRNGTNNTLIWRGTTVAASYTIERSATALDRDWTVICKQCVTDTNTPWMDTTAPASPLWYRIIAYNLSGVTGKPSSPYQAGTGRILIDNLHDWSKVYDHSSNLTFDTSNAQYMGGDTSYVKRNTQTNEHITWKQNSMTSFQAVTHFWPYEPIEQFSLYTSSNGIDWIPAHPQINSIYRDWLEYIYTLNGLSNVNYVKVVWNNQYGHSWSPTINTVTITY